MEHTYNNLNVSHQEGNFQIYLDFELEIDLLEMMLHLSSDGMLDPLKFKTFWDTFECVVHKESSIDDLVRFTDLRDKLEGKAKLALEGLTLTKENYSAAVKLLKERFGDEQVIIQAHMDALLALEKVEEGNVTELRKLCDVIEVHIRNLQNFQIAVANYGPILISIIVQRLPEDVNLEVARKMPDGKWDIDMLMETVKKEVAARERCGQRSHYPSTGGVLDHCPLSTMHIGTKGGRGGSRQNN